MKNLPDDNSLYTASNTEIFYKNFLAGFARGLGGLAVNLAFLAIVYFSFVSIVLPKIRPFVDAFINAQESIGRFQNPGFSLDEMLQTPKRYR
jgi:hypothetical protein